MALEHIHTKYNPADGGEYVSQNRKRRRDGGDDEEDEDSWLDPSKRYSIADFVPGTLPDHYIKRGLYKHIRAFFGECIERRCLQSWHKVPDVDFGHPMLEVYRVKIVIKDAERAKEIYGIDPSFNTPSFLYGAIKVCKVRATPGWENEGEALFSMEKDNPQSVKFINGTYEIPLRLRDCPYSLLSDSAMVFAFKLNDVDLLCASAPNYNEGHLAFGREKIVCGRIYFGRNHISQLRGSFVESKRVWGSYITPLNKDDEDLISVNPISVYVDYGLHDGVLAKVLSVHISDPSVTNVSGHISADFCTLGLPTFNTLLFQGSGALVDQENHTVSLQRSCIVVPSNSYLLIEVKLHDQQGKLFVHATFPFMPSEGGVFVSDPSNNKIQIHVKFYDFPPEEMDMK
ncbi:unnamed protein product [Cuscuta epithymum]|uniref:Uncharacterized protein n=1 Tax=Cuscuta epithymum TaxID=186058 RepID=A0AAV0BYY8_9ASTE|nr:unnamed protein product [Cuscuta epithymum]